ncbi:hypothetical protein M514_08879 [Trichuris suis]|uniref:DDE-1 domain-containing protein n=1 Tax=Trichuris suis TaxID=68888 RepID=A0A085LZ55_9BILA|nr:hypothetical protein M513_08879 [Trichuris suis]KFD66935.1 hypothetical protein M514_08879 [Trichuris suis]
MLPKRKRVVPTFKEKSEIVEALDRGETGRLLCDKYGSGKATICDIRKKGETIRARSRKMNEEVGSSKRKVMKPSMLEEVEQALYLREELAAFLEEGDYDEDFIYNADETGLNWKALPSRSLIARSEERVSGPKRRKERVTIMVKKYQGLTGKTGKVLLLIDNAPAHPSAEYLNVVDELVTVKFLPPNVSALIQPMDQGVIEILKWHYRKQLLR